MRAVTKVPGIARLWALLRSSRLAQVALALLFLAVLVRAILPPVLERLLVSQGEQYVNGQLSVENVDLWVFGGGVAIEGFALWPEGERPEEGREPSEPPLVAFQRIYANVSWLSLVQQIVRVEDFSLDGLRVHLARLQDRTIVFPELRELPEPPEPEPESSELPAFPIVIDRAALREAAVTVRDDVPGRPTFREITLPSLVVEHLAINDREATRPGEIVVNAAMGEGTIRVAAQVSQRGQTFDARSSIDIVALPLDQLHVHEPSLPWNESRGRLDTELEIELDTDGRLAVRGDIEVGDLEVRVPRETEPALAWRRLGIEIEEIDLGKQLASVRSVALDGAAVLVRPDQNPPLPLIPADLAPTQETPAAGDAPPDVEHGKANADASSDTAGAAPEAATTPEPSAESSGGDGGADGTPTAGQEPQAAPVSSGPNDTTEDADPASELASAPETDAAETRAATADDGGTRKADDATASDGEAPEAGEATADSDGPPEAEDVTSDDDDATVDSGGVPETDDVASHDDGAPDANEATADSDGAPKEDDATADGDDAPESDEATTATDTVAVAPKGEPEAADANEGSEPTSESPETDDGPETTETSPEAAAAPKAEPAPSDAPAGPLDWKVIVGSVEITDSTVFIEIIAPSKKKIPLTAHAGRLLVTDIAARGPEHWSVGRVELTDSSGDIRLPPGPARVDVSELTVEGLSTDPEKPIVLVAHLTESSSAIDLEVEAVQRPENLVAKLGLSDVELGRYATLSGSSPVRLPSGTLQANLQIEGDRDKGRLTGTLNIDDARILTQDGEDDFSVGWDAVAVDLRALELSPTDLDVPMRLEIADLQVDGPRMRVTLTDEGIVLPTVRQTDDLIAVAAEDESAAVDAPSDPSAPRPPDAEDTKTTTEETTATSGEATTTNEEPETDPASPAPPEPQLRQGLVAQTEAVGIEEIAEAVEPAIELPMGVAIDHLRISNGTFRLVDRSVRPTYRGKVTDFRYELKGLDLPHGAPAALTSFEEMSFSLKAPGEAPLRLKAERQTKGLDVNFRMEELPLSQFNPYVQRAVGYSLLRGAATAETTFHWDEERYRAETDLDLLSLDVGNEKGGTLFADVFGVSIGTALALLRDVYGNIGFDIPLSGSRAQDLDVSITSIVRQAVTQAIVGALTSPLKLLGSVTMSGEKLDDISPTPVAFLPGSAEMPDDAGDQIERMGDVLAATPAIKLEFIGRAGASDVRALKEAAVLAEMQSDGGFWGGVLNLASGGTRNAIRSALEDRDTSGLSEDDQATLDELVAEKSVTDEDLETLARERAETLRTRLIDDSGIDEDQISLGAPEASRDDTPPEVGVNLLSRAYEG